MQSSYRWSRILAAASALSLALAVSAAAGDAPPDLSSEQRAESSRFESWTGDRAVGKAAAPNTCEASKSRGELVGTLKSIEQKLAAARAQQAAHWKKNGWDPEQAAAAGEAVMLNGTGYNYRATAPPPARVE